MSRSLSATSYAILGLLAIRPWTPYEMTHQMRYSLGRFWPRAQSKLYEEPKKLVEHGFATAIPDSHGKRPRTRYEITDAGRTALGSWLTTPPQMPELEAEPLLRVFLAEHGRKTTLINALETVQTWATTKLIDDARVARGYLNGQGRFPRRVAQVTLVGRFLSDFALMTHQWSQWALGVVHEWPDDLADLQPDREALAAIVARAENLTTHPLQT